ncbi:hypothetical protein MASR1M66_22460 [Aminivibrio sp.]
MPGSGNESVAFLQCASLYPAPPHIMNLKSMETIRRAFGVPTGLSDHTEGIHVSVAAAAMGASIIEKRFTLDRTLQGPDRANHRAERTQRACASDSSWRLLLETDENLGCSGGDGVLWHGGASMRR